MAELTKRVRGLRNNPTEAEKLLWKKLQHEQLGFKFRRQHPIGRFIVDFINIETGLIIEADGGQHADNADDIERTKWLESQGYKVIRFWNNEVLGNIDGVLQVIDETLKALPPNPPSRKRAGGLNPHGSTPPIDGRGGKGGRADYRSDFPVLQKTMNGQPVVFLDSGASAQKPRAVIDAMRAVMDTDYANIHRGLYQFSQVTTAKFEAVRQKVADFIGAASEKEIVFTRNTTEAINLVAQSWGRAHLQAGDEIIISGMEHHANIVPWQLLRDQIGVIIKVIPVLDDGTLDLAAYKALLGPQVKLVAVVHISNALGTINPVAQMVAMARLANPAIKILIDGSQAVVHGAVNVTALGPDFYVFTGHKLYGPTGVGVLYGRFDVLQSMPPYQGGGDMIERVTFEKTTYKDAPARFEAGTPAIIEVIGLGAAIDYVSMIGMNVIAAQEHALLSYALDRLRAVGGLTLYGPMENRAGIISFTADWGHASDIAMVLDQCGVAVRSGHHCCMPLMQRFDVDATVRASLGLYSNTDDIDALVNGLLKARELLG